MPERLAVQAHDHGMRHPRQYHELAIAAGELREEVGKIAHGGDAVVFAADQ